jgi:hypothetical protein
VAITPLRKIRTGAKQADRIRGDRRRSLHSGNPDRRSAGGLRGLPGITAGDNLVGGSVRAALFLFPGS